jgi:Fe-S cluster assembly ATPase SufC
MRLLLVDMKIVSEGVNILHERDPQMGVLVITHYQRLLTYINDQRPEGRVQRAGTGVATRGARLRLAA